MTLEMGAFWLDPLRGTVPLGWEVAPAFAELAPAVLEHYYRTATPNDYLICGPSGASYAYMSCLSDPDGFLAETAGDEAGPPAERLGVVLLQETNPTGRRRSARRPAPRRPR